jgi:hypothetical protein
MTGLFVPSPLNGGESACTAPPHALPPTDKDLAILATRSFPLLAKEIQPYVNWLILGSKLPRRVVPDHPVDLGLGLSGAIDLGEMFWLAVYLGWWLVSDSRGGATTYLPTYRPR